MRLSDNVTIVPRISDRYAKTLTKLGIHTIRDLITHFPRDYKDESDVTPIVELKDGEKTVISAYPKSVKSIRLRNGKTMQTGVLSDSTGSIKATWFNQPWLEKQLAFEKEYLISGNAKDYRGSLSFFPSNLEAKKTSGEQLHLGRIVPQYKLTEGVSAKWLRGRIKTLVENLNLSAELLNISKKLNLDIDLLEAIYQVHFPSSEEDLSLARGNLQLIELTNLLLDVIGRQESREKFKAPQFTVDTNLIESFINGLAFELTADQKSTVDLLITKLSTQKEPLNDLVQGDVGTGKTIIAIICALAVVRAGFQVVVLAPTTILAEQHYQNFSKLLNEYNLAIHLVTGKTKSEESGQILIGTSAVLARKNKLITNLGLVIVDEQHRFGVRQRSELLEPLVAKTTGSKQRTLPHLITMTATPIPRSLALALFRDISVSTIRTKPKGRKPINTFLVSETKRADSYEWVENKVKEEHEQVYWICPLIEESEKLEIKSAKETFDYLRTEPFKDLKLALLHGKLKNDEKTKIMDDFANGKIDVLVSTSVIEVGVDVANATVMVIEGAERFGLAQLHQIRGRVGRSDKQSWCFLFPSTNISEQGLERLSFFSNSNDGLDIANFDLQLRGPGEVYGTRQSGVPNLKIANIMDLEKLEQARTLAQKLSSQGVQSIELFQT